MSDKNNPIFYTSDLGISAYLMTVGHRLVTLNTQNFSRVLFGFTNGDDLEQEITDYQSGRAKVDPACFYANIKSLKLRLSNIKN